MKSIKEYLNNEYKKGLTIIWWNISDIKPYKRPPFTTKFFKRKGLKSYLYAQYMVKTKDVVKFEKGNTTTHWSKKK